MWQSKLQMYTTLSSTEAELVALSAATKEVQWITQLLSEIGIKYKIPITIFNDNTSTIHLANSKSFNPKTKHLNVKDKFVKEKIADGLIEVKHIKSEENTADFLTMSLPTNKFKKLEFSFSTPVFNRASIVLIADSFDLYSITANTMCSYEYTGPNAVLYESTKELCKFKSLNLLGHNSYILSPHDNCVNDTLFQDTWMKDKCIKFDNQVILPQIERIKNKIAVYCVKQKILIEGEEIDCPEYVFHLPLHMNFTIGEYKYTVSSKIDNATLNVEHWNEDIDTIAKSIEVKYFTIPTINKINQPINQRTRIY